MTKNMEIKERLLADPCANEDHDPHLYGNKLEDSPAYAAIRKANLLVGEYRREDLADLWDQVVGAGAASTISAAC